MILKLLKIKFDGDVPVKIVLILLIRFIGRCFAAKTNLPVYPTCSHYAVQAVEKYGAWKGFWLAVKRVLKCHPFHPGGYDTV